MALFAASLSRARQSGRKQRRGFVAGAVVVGIAVGGCGSSEPGAATGASSHRSEPASSILAKYAVTGYPIGSGGTPTGPCHVEQPQMVSCDSFLILLALKRSATSVVVAFDGLSGKLKRPKVKPGATWPSSAVPLSTGTFFIGQIPTVSLLKSKNAGRGSRAFPAVGKSGYGTFHVLITLSDGSRITTDFRAYLQRGWR